MFKKTKNGFYVLEKFARISNLFHGFSTVDFGNMSFAYGTKKEVLKNRRRFAQAVGVDPERLASVHQRHGTNILIVGPGSSIGQTEEIIADGLMTNQRNACLFIKSADCLPILLFDSQKRVIGLVHAGRKGVMKKIHLKAILKMRDNFGCQPKNLLVGIGPAICPHCYHGKIDLIDSVLVDFQKVGIQKENIEIAEVCTFESPDFYSHRRGEKTRFATIIALK